MDRKLKDCGWVAITSGELGKVVHLGQTIVSDWLSWRKFASLDLNKQGETGHTFSIGDMPL